MAYKVAVNGFGRIGRLTVRRLLEKENINIVAVNDLTDVATLAHLFKYDTIHRQFQGAIEHDKESITINGDTIKILAEKDPSKLPWKELGVDLVIESTGRFTSKEDASMHLDAGAKKVLISAPAKGGVKTIVLGVNDDQLTAKDKIISNASCTTNCLAPMAKVLDDSWGIERGFMTTIHAYTSDQNLQDAPHKDLRRARAAAQSIIPTSTGAAKAVGLVLPHLQGKLDGNAMRVPVIDGSVTDFTAILKKEPSAEEINNKVKELAGGALKGIIEYTNDPIVSSDIIGNSHSCIFDAELTSVMGNMVKVVGWYDNEYGYASRLADLAERMMDI